MRVLRVCKRICGYLKSYSCGPTTLKNLRLRHSSARAVVNLCAPTIHHVTYACTYLLACARRAPSVHHTCPLAPTHHPTNQPTNQPTNITNRYTDVREKLLDPKTQDWFLKFDPSKNGSYRVPRCDDYHHPP
jgi:hypothetical protein